MLREKITLSILMICLVVSTAFNQTTKTQKKELHSYGGWFCPDNLGGFPPVDIQELDKVPVVNDRLPTKEETRNGTSLMYIDKNEIPNAKPLDMTLPRVARIYSRQTDMIELVIVIQAVVAGPDTVVGYRFPSGGNGSARIGEVTFLSDDDVEKLGPNPYVYHNSEINASKAKIWKAITSTKYVDKLVKQFGKKAVFESDWTDESRAYLSYESDKLVASGVVMTLFGNLYIQVDYDYEGFHFSEKVLVSENREKNTSELHVVSGPYPEDIKSQRVLWNNWIDEVKKISENK